MPIRLRGIITLALALSAAGADRKPVTPSSVLTQSSDKMGQPVWAPGGRRFVFIEDKQLRLYNVPSRSERVLASLSSLEAAAVKPAPPSQNEWRNRYIREQVVQWFPSGKQLLVSAGGDLFSFQIGPGGWTQITATPETEHDPKLSPDGRRISFRRAHDLYVMELQGRKVTRLTHDGSATLWNAEPDWVYPEELALETAHWWSPDSKHIAYLQFDVGNEPLYPHTDLLQLPARLEPQRYPRPGDPNADVRLGVVTATGGRTAWMDARQTPDSLLARVYWLPNSSSLAVIRMNRIQNRLEVLLVNAQSGVSSSLIEETDPYWVNLHDDLKFIREGQELLWSSERDGFRHLYRYSIKGKQIARLTRGEWPIRGIAGIDERDGEVFFTGSEAGPLETHLYRVGLNGEGFKRITAAGMTHSVSVSPDCEYFFDTASSLRSPVVKALYTAAGEEWARVRGPDRKVLDEYEILPAEIVPVKAADGATLYARLTRPAGFKAGVKYPAVVFVYGGPHAQSVRNSWNLSVLEQALAHRGFVLWQLDNRGTAGRGRAWESAVFRNLGRKELEDQKEGVRHLLSLGFVDADRIGINGWSYGGFMTLYSLLHAPGIFKAGVAGAPVTDWRNYDSIYTERYMGLPQDNVEGYKTSAPVNAAANLRASLLIAHNIQDDNVLFQNSLRMADALEKAGKQFEMVVYPQKTHHVTGAVHKHLDQTILNFFERTLK